MHMIPKAKPTRGAVDLLDGPANLAATFWGGRKSPHEIQQEVIAWKNTLARPVRNVTLAIEAIAWAQGIPFLSKTFGPECLGLAELLSNLPAEVDESCVRDQPLIHQLLAGELAWTLAACLPKGAPASRLEKSGRAAISLGLNRILDRQGMLAAKNFRIMRPLLACWTRCRALAAKLPGGGLAPRPEQLFLRFVRNALRCNRPDGQPLFAKDELGAKSEVKGSKTSAKVSWGRDLFDAVLTSGVDETDRLLAALALPVLSPGVAGKPPKKSADLPSPSICFEDGATAVMRSSWEREDASLAVLFPEKTCELELVAPARLAISGAWQFEVYRDGQLLEPVSNWESSCWYSDSEVDYLELEIGLSGGVTVERQIVLARDDRFLILADAVLSREPGELKYRSILPLVAGVEFRGAEESREGLLIGSSRKAAAARPLAHVLPLGMPEWRAEPFAGELRSIPEGLELRHGLYGQGLLAPLFIDLDRKRFRRRMTWRRLTVAEGLRAVGPDKAVGFRVAIGSEQWIFYRALAANGNRTLLGHNLSTGSLIARFGKAGAVKSIVEIE
jgi:hypothetical protein